MQKHTWISRLCVPVILSGTRRMINAQQYWFSSSPFESISFIYPTKLCLSLSECKRHRDTERIGNSGNSAHWALMYGKGFKTVWLKRHHSPPQSHFLSGLPVYTCCPRWAGWPIFLWITILQPITGKTEDKNPQSCLSYTETLTAEEKKRSGTS